jgi:CRP/FNR family cyclic AMP-dependent transcriptional regulator
LNRCAAVNGSRRQVVRSSLEQTSRSKEEEKRRIRSGRVLRNSGQGPRDFATSPEGHYLCAGRRCGFGVLHQEGKVKVTVVSEQGKEAVVAILGVDEFIGEGCLIGQAKRLATAAAMTDCETMRVGIAQIQQVLQDEPKFSQMFITHILARNARVEADLVDQLFNSTEKRLARVLLLLANFGKEGRPEPLIAKISQETLAEMIGSTRSRVSHFMNKFRQLGFIDYNGKLEIHSSLLSVVLNEQPSDVMAPRLVIPTESAV